MIKKSFWQNASERITLRSYAFEPRTRKANSFLNAFQTKCTPVNPNFVSFVLLPSRPAICCLYRALLALHAHRARACSRPAFGLRSAKRVYAVRVALLPQRSSVESSQVCPAIAARGCRISFSRQRMRRLTVGRFCGARMPVDAALSRAA